MTTLFPQIKRVDEDETSKIIKNVLFDDQDEIKLEQIFDEFMHLTEESITYSDEDDDDVDVDEEEEEDDEDDDDDDDDDEDDDDDDDSDSESESDESESSESDEEKKSNEISIAPPSREPFSWNLDQFINTIPINKPQDEDHHHQNNSTIINNNNNTTTSTPIAATISPIIRNTSHSDQPQPQPPPQPQPQPQPQLQLQPQPQPQPPQQQPQHHPQPTTQPSGSYLVQIDLSKLKRIPTTKAPTPTTANSNSIMTAKALKHEADAEKDKTKQAMKYLESAMYFILYGFELETSSKNVTYYNDTIPLFKHVLKLSMPGSDNPDNMTNLKVYTLALRCLSLVHSKLYKVRERELMENNKIINSQQNSSPIQQADTLLLGIKPQLLSAYKRQLAIFNYLKYANDYWQQADHLCDQHPAVRIFFSTIESNCGSLTMITQFSRLMDHVKCGLKLLRIS